ncbi:hypothetical protein CTA2_5931 [Colletotrichum tanaceti]|uniref:Uncharacterized protein n=1 Tax=Colletotrichum tanaceti TaxID=1306861 RepID=A0A4V6Y9H3_9PEZI|nr:hypothetical protein CTA2_5931 [Colletotrichum tanaceti]TKW55106.1 hypothetical protein CTA1_7002 [Colletotrichum tanaceti]
MQHRNRHHAWLLHVRGFCLLLVGFGLLRGSFGRLGRLGLLHPGKPAQLLDGVACRDLGSAPRTTLRSSLYSKNMKSGIAVTLCQRATSWAGSTLTLTQARELGRPWVLERDS